MSGGANETPRILVVIRHAKAEAWATTDHERSLTDRGRRDATATGRWLAEAGVDPDAAVVSDSTRTRETWEQLAAGAGWSLEPGFDRAAYTAGTDAALDLLRELADDVRSAVLLGHNPTVGSLAQLLDDGAGDPDAVTQLLVRGFPTSAAAVFEVPGGWAELAEGGAVLRGYYAGHPEGD